MKKLLLILFVFYIHSIYAQNILSDSSKVVKLDEVVLSVNKFELKKKTVAQPIASLNALQIKNINAANTADLLQASGFVAVQKSQLGGGSVILRGFEASRVLLMIDGVRMNNAIYRAGHLQDVITLDNAIIDKVEILYGPSSTMYGSDALGGVVHFYTKKPVLSNSAKTKIFNNAYYRFGTAASEHTAHADIQIGGKKIASFTSITVSSFGDLRQGKSRNSEIGNLGKRNFYQARINNVDTMLANTNPSVQKESGYRQLDFLQKVLFQSSDKLSHLFNFQLSTSSDIPRYDRLSEMNSSGIFRSAEWYYGPQKRNLFSYELYRKKLSGFFSEIKALPSFQFIEQSRYNRNWKSDFLNRRIEKVYVAAFTLDAHHKSLKHDFTAGIDIQMNRVKSVASRLNIVTNAVSKLDTRYPDGKNEMNFFAAYVSDIFKLSNHFYLNGGIRLSFTSLHSTIHDTSIFKLPYTEANQKHTAATSNLGVVFVPESGWKLALSFSSGFRSPNIDDLIKIFESVSGQRLIVPNTNLKPENVSNSEISISKQFGKLIRAEINVFYTRFTNAIVIDRFLFNGQSAIVYNGSLTQVYAAQNKSQANLTGYSTAISGNLNNCFSFYGQFSFTYGRIKNDDGTKTPLDHIPPVYGNGGIKFENNKISIETYVLFNGAKRSKDYNLTGEDNPQYSADPVNGYTPSWFTFNLRSSIQINKVFQLQVALENILDRNYRTFSSGISGPGRNFIATFRASF